MTHTQENKKLIETFWMSLNIGFRKQNLKSSYCEYIQLKTTKKFKEVKNSMTIMSNNNQKKWEFDGTDKNLLKRNRNGKSWVGKCGN